MPEATVLRCRVRYLSDGAILGRQECSAVLWMRGRSSRGGATHPK